MFQFEAGWSVDREGAHDVTILESVGGGSTTATITTGNYCHTDLSSFEADYSDFATKLKSALETASANGLTYTVTWNSTTQRYTISVSAGTVSLTFTGNDGLRMKQALGFSGNRSTAGSHNSDITPFYAITAEQDGPANSTDEYEGGEAAEESEADDGSHDGHAWETVPIYEDFDVKLEPKSKVFDYEAISSVPWTYKDFFKNNRNYQPFLTRNSLTGQNVVRFLRASGASFKATRNHPEFDDVWDITFQTRIKGRL